jgi:hypothetical protein
VFRTQEWFNLARDDVVRQRRTPPLVSFFGWLGPPDNTGGFHSALVDKLGVSRSRSRLLAGPQRYHPRDSTTGPRPQC